MGRSRSLSKADKSEVISNLKKLRDAVPDKEAAGEACKGMYQCYKKGDKKCLEKIEQSLVKLSKSGGIAGGISGGAHRSRSKSRKVKK